MEDMLDDYLDFRAGIMAKRQARLISARLSTSFAAIGARWPDVQVRLNDTLDETLRVKHNALRRCITNLVNNACAHAKLVHVSARRDPDGTNVLITVDDNGTGIPAENREDVFRHFIVWMMRAPRKWAAPALGWPLPATLRADMAATLRSTKAIWAACRRAFQFPLSSSLILVVFRPRQIAGALKRG